MTEPTAPAVPSVIDQLRNTAREAHQRAAKELAHTRQQRDALNAQIAVLVATEADLRRAVGALTRGRRGGKKGSGT